MVFKFTLPGNDLFNSIKSLSHSINSEICKNGPQLEWNKEDWIKFYKQVEFMFKEKK
jgi:hypothetical protein